METMFWIWLGVIAVTLIIEIVTLDLVSIWFSVGAILPFILSAIGGVHIEIQIFLFVVVSALLIIFLRKYAQRLLFKNMNTKTNMDALIGKHYRLLENIEFEKNGTIKINDVVWTAISENGENIDAGSIVEVVKEEGNKIVVKKVEGSGKEKEAQTAQIAEKAVDAENETTEQAIETEQTSESQEVEIEQNKIQEVVEQTKNEEEVE